MKGLIIVGVLLAALVWFCFYACQKEAETLTKICGLNVTASDVFWAGDKLRCMNSSTIK